MSNLHFKKGGNLDMRHSPSKVFVADQHSNIRIQIGGLDQRYRGSRYFNRQEDFIRQKEYEEQSRRERLRQEEERRQREYQERLRLERERQEEERRERERQEEMERREQET